MLLLHKARQQPDGGRSPAAAGGESRRSLLCSAEGGTGCARCCGLLELAEGGKRKVCGPTPKFRGWLQSVIIMLSWVLLELLAAGRQRVKMGRMVRKIQKFRRFCNREERK